MRPAVMFYLPVVLPQLLRHDSSLLERALPMGRVVRPPVVVLGTANIGNEEDLWTCVT